MLLPGADDELIIDSELDFVTLPPFPTEAAGKRSLDGGLRLQSCGSQDFSPKGGPKDAVAKWDGDGIVFPEARS